MADTKHGPPSVSVDGDGVNYAGIVWFVVILTVVTVVCQVLMWGLFEVLKDRAASQDVARAPLSAPALQAPPGPTLLAVAPDPTAAPGTLSHLGEPANLQEFRAKEDLTLTTYDWTDKNAGLVRIPIDRAKELLLERGLPVRSK